MPIVFNTSFNNNVEPIVDSIDDAVTCFLTTKLDYLVIADYLIKKKQASDGILDLKLSLPVYVQLCGQRQFVPASGFVESHWCKHSVVEKYNTKISRSVYDLLRTQTANVHCVNCWTLRTFLAVYFWRKSKSCGRDASSSLNLDLTK